MKVKLIITMLFLSFFVLVPGKVLYATSAQTTETTTQEHEYPDGSRQTPDLSVAGTGFGAFEWFGQFVTWFTSQKIPLPGGYNIKFLDVGIAVVFLYLLGWVLGKIIVGRRSE